MFNIYNNSTVSSKILGKLPKGHASLRPSSVSVLETNALRI